MNKDRYIKLGIIALIGAIILINVINLLPNKNSKNQKSTNTGLFFWGKKENNQNKQNSFFKQITWLPKISKISAGHDHILILTNDGNIFSLGDNTFGQLGKESSSFQEDAEKIPQLWNIQDIAANGHHSLALDKEGNIWSWGLNLSSQLGDESNDIRAGPQKVNNLTKIKAISAGYRFSVAVREDGTVVAWGASCDSTKSQDTQNVIRLFASSLTQSGGYGDPASNSSQAYNFSDDCQREKSTGIASKTPKEIKNLSNVKKISSGFGHTVALKEDGTVWAFGCNKYGQIGNNTKENALEAVPLTAVPKIIEVAAGYRHSLALDEDGTVWSWGYEEKLQPTKIEAIAKVKHISAGYDYSLAVLENGEVYGWGSNASKQLSIKDIQSSNRPIKLDMINNAQIVAAGGTQAVALNQN